MSVIAAVLKELMAAGVEGEALVEAIARVEASQQPVLTPRQARNKRYYAKRKASENRLNSSETSNSDVQDEKKIPPHPPKENPKRPPTGVQKVGGYSAEFERFRQAYPARDGGHGWSKASESFEAHRKSGVDPEDMIRGAEIYAADCRRAGKIGTEFVKQAASFLRGRHWPEWLEKAAPRVVSANGWPLQVDEAKAKSLYLRGIWPHSAFGPEPGTPGCRIPDSIQRQWLAEKSPLIQEKTA